MCCYLIPVTCCGPPVIFAKEPKCCGLVSLAPCFGVPVYYAPTNCFGLKTYLCCGQPCYTSCAAGLVAPSTAVVDSSCVQRLHALASVMFSSSL